MLAYIVDYSVGSQMSPAAVSDQRKRSRWVGLIHTLFLFF